MTSTSSETRQSTALLATLDTKLPEALALRSFLMDRGLHVHLIDMSTGPHPVPLPTAVPATTLPRLPTTATPTRAEAVAHAGEMARRVLIQMSVRGEIGAAIGLGGSGGTSAAAHAMQGLPLWFPKLIVSTVASGATAGYVGTSDIILVPTLVDLAGTNYVVLRVLERSAAILHALLTLEAGTPPPRSTPTVATTMFGVTTPCVQDVKRQLENDDYEVLTFHATGIGGRLFEQFIDAGQVIAALDVTTTELADEVVGGTMSAGPGRLRSAAQKGIPQVVSAGALDMVNFGAANTVPILFQHRTLLRHNAEVTLLRTSPEENAGTGALMAARLRDAKAAVEVVIPTQGFSELSRDGGPFHDDAADAAFIDALTDGLDGSGIPVRLVKANINDNEFVAAVLSAFYSVIKPWQESHERRTT